MLKATVILILLNVSTSVHAQPTSAWSQPVNILATGQWPWRDLAVLLGAGGTMWLAAGVLFARRDLCTV